MGMLRKGIGLAGAAAIVIFLAVMRQPAMAQSTDGSRPGDLCTAATNGVAA